MADLERSNEALGGERLKLIDEMEDLRETKEGLTEDVAKLEKTRDLLTANLREHEAKVAELSKRSSEYEGLVKELEQEVSSGQIQITQLREGLRLNLAQDILFRSGSATLEPYGVELLTQGLGAARQVSAAGRGAGSYRQRSGLQVLALGHELGARGRARGVGRAAVREAGHRPDAPARGLLRRARAGRQQRRRPRAARAIAASISG